MLEEKLKEVRVLPVQTPLKPPSTRQRPPVAGDLGTGMEEKVDSVWEGLSSCHFPHLAFMPRLRPERSLPKGRWQSWRKPLTTWKVKGIFLCTPEPLKIGPYSP